MTRRRPFALSMASLSCILLAGGTARAGGAFLTGGSDAPIEHRVVVAASGSRVTVWTSVTYSGTSGQVGLVVPVPPGAALDFASAAWIEALDAATAPRVFPPPGEAAACSGTGAGTFQDTEAPLTPIAVPLDTALLDDADAVSTWAGTHGLEISAVVFDQLASMAGKRFLAVALSTDGGQRSTPTIRVVMPGGSPVLPLALAGGSQAIEVTTWLVGEGRGRLTAGGADLTIDPSTLVWKAESGTSDYLEARDALLAQSPAGSGVVESANHDALVFELPLGDGAAIPAVAREYFVRAGAKGDVPSTQVDACAASATLALGATGVVWDACPRADLGVVDGTNTCMETPVGGGTDPNDLRCGGIGDDLAVALSGLVPQATWVTRRVMRIEGGALGADWPLSFSSGQTVTPVIDTGAVDSSGCPSSSSGPGPSGAGPSGGGVVFVEDPDPDVTCGCSDTSGTVEPDDDGDGSTTTSAGGGGEGQGGDGQGGAGEGGSTQSGPSGSGVTSGGADGDDGGSSDDGGCSGDTTEEREDDESDGCDCGGTETEGDGDEGDDDSSSGDTSDGSSGSDDGCDSDSGQGDGDDGCDCGNGNCAVADADPPSRAKATKKKMRRRLSPIALGLLAALLPVRRATRKKRI